RRDLTNFLFIWNRLHESQPDEAKGHLYQVARVLRINQAALRMLKRDNRRDRLLAIVTLGKLREATGWDALLSITRSGGALMSIAAARALIMIDAGKAVPELIPLLTVRSDW